MAFPSTSPPVSHAFGSPANAAARLAQLPFPRRLAILGSTGSIGCNVLRVVDELPGRFQVVALAAGGNLEGLVEQVRRYRPELVAVRDACDVDRLRDRLRSAGVHPLPAILCGADGLQAATLEGAPDMVVSAIVGVAGVAATYAAVQRGCPVALANKETLVVAGDLIMAAVRATGAPLLPIDSEHSALHQCWRAGAASEVARLILTASGGPFRHRDPGTFKDVTPQEALQHPTWRMGGRITIDSATLMNKGFEVIEACHLFGLEERAVEVVVHPQSIVHSLLEFQDGSVMAQLGPADMRLPIQYALTYPERVASSRPRLRLEELGRLDFEAADPTKFPCLRLAREAYRAGGAGPAILNAADEVAVAAFLAGAIPFVAIPRIIEEVLMRLGSLPAGDLDAIWTADGAARRVAQELAGTMPA